MDEAEETYCRLCAEPTDLEQLISIDDDVGQNSKITTKMLWINIDVSKSNILPKTICFSCFDLLERTWGFLNNVRSAQDKLFIIYSKRLANGVTFDIPIESVAKPVDKGWKEFRDCQDIKSTVKVEISIDNNAEVTTVEQKASTIKQEPNSDLDLDLNNSFGNSSDSDMPLKLAAKRKKVKSKKKKKKYDEELLTTTELECATSEVIDMSIFTMTWDDYMWCCADCDAQCKTLDSLRLHSIEIHDHCCSHKCTDCGKIIASHSNFISHVRLHYKSLRYHCDVCNQQFSMSGLMKKHYNTAHRLHSNACKNCGMNFETDELLQDHINLYAKNTRKHEKFKEEKLDSDLKCSICMREFKSRSNLHAHKMTHLDRSRDFSCHMCGKKFFTKGALSTHMLTHEDTKPFKCEYCSMAFRARGNLTSHISMHSSAKSFLCEQCGKSFRVKRHLKSHSIVHTDLMPYVCEYCNKRFRFKTRLNLHVRQHTGAKPYSCIYCRRDFTNGSNYKKHMKRRHSIDTSTRQKYNTIVNQAVEAIMNGGNNVTP